MDGEGPSRAALEALALSEARLKRAQRVARLGSWEIDLATRAMWGSDEAFRVYGLPPTPDRQLPLGDVQAIPLPEYRVALDRALADLLAGTAPYDLRFRIRRRDDGAVRTIHSFAEVHRDEAGRPVRITGTIQDITEQEARDQALVSALRASEERARMAVEQAADAIFLGDRQGDFVAVNERAVELTGYSREELLAGNIRMLFDPRVLSTHPLRYDLVQAGQTVTAERPLTRKDGAQVPVEMTARRLPDGTLQAIVRDIGERRRLEEQLQLRQRMDSVGVLASGIAHDFNNIVAGILGFAELLRLDEQALTAEQRDAVAAISQSCRRAADLVQGLQAASHDRAGEAECFDVGVVAAEVLAVLRETTDRLVLKELRLEPGRHWARASASGAYHALMNLCVNAVQAIEQKGPGPGDRVVVGAEEHLAGDGNRLGLAPGRWIHLTVTDTGVGMTDEVRQRAFHPLFSTKEKGARKGQGLGLAMVYNVVVRQHGGAVDVESAPGRGSTFHLYLPAGEPARHHGDAASRQPAAAGGTILVVEDEETIARFVRRALEREGYAVQLAVDGVEALERFGPDGRGIDLVLLDRTLPRLGGEQVLERMLARRPGARVVVSTGDATAEPDAFPGAVALLRKPYAPADLCALVRALLAAEPAPPTGG